MSFEDSLFLSVLFFAIENTVRRVSGTTWLFAATSPSM
jgi:hypothetical protein